MRYLDCPEGTVPWKLRQLLEVSTPAIDPAVVQIWQELIGFSEVHRAAFAILCLPPPLLRQQGSLVLRSGVWCCPAVHECHMSLIKRWLGCGTLSWSRSMGQVGTLASSSPMRNHGEVASSQFSGMLNGLQNAALSRPMPSRAWQCCAIGTT